MVQAEYGLQRNLPSVGADRCQKEKHGVAVEIATRLKKYSGSKNIFLVDWL